MVSLRKLETHKSFQAWTRGAGADSLRHIVGTQFRNCATVGGSIYGRFGFSDVLDAVSGSGRQVKLFKGGVLPLREFLDREEDGDILLSVLVKKGQAFAAYESMRNEAVDFPVLTAAVCLRDGQFTVSVGARTRKGKSIFSS